MGKNVQQVQIPGAQPAASPQPEATDPSQPDADEQILADAADLDMPKAEGAPKLDELPPDLQRLVAAEVAKALAKQAAANKPPAGKPTPHVTPYAEAVAQQAKLPPHERKSVLTEYGYYCPPGMGSLPPGTNQLT